MNRIIDVYTKKQLFAGILRSFLSAIYISLIVGSAWLLRDFSFEYIIDQIWSRNEAGAHIEHIAVFNELISPSAHLWSLFEKSDLHVCCLKSVCYGKPAKATAYYYNSPGISHGLYVLNWNV